MIRVFLLLTILCSTIFAQKNFSGYKDTVKVSSFGADSTGTTKAFELSQYENILFYVMANDTSSAGYASDSIKFIWGVEFLNVVLNSSNKQDTAVLGRIQCDTFDIATAGNLTVQTKLVDTVGTFNWFQKFIDTTSITGYAIQHSAPIPYWTPIFRFWYTGLSGNVTGSFVPLVFGQSRRLASYTMRP